MLTTAETAFAYAMQHEQEKNNTRARLFLLEQVILELYKIIIDGGHKPSLDLQVLINDLQKMHQS